MGKQSCAAHSTPASPPSPQRLWPASSLPTCCVVAPPASPPRRCANSLPRFARRSSDARSTSSATNGLSVTERRRPRPPRADRPCPLRARPRRAPPPAAPTASPRVHHLRPAAARVARAAAPVPDRPRRFARAPAVAAGKATAAGVTMTDARPRRGLGVRDALRRALPVISAALACFLAVLAVLTARVTSGQDPTLRATASTALVSRGGRTVVRTTASGRVPSQMSSASAAQPGVAPTPLVTRTSGGPAGEADD